MREFELFPDIAVKHKFPSTRYQGSKAKFADWIWNCIKVFPFDTVLDAFGGTGCISYMFKQNNKQVTYNDILRFNYLIGKALIENSNTVLSDIEVEVLLSSNKDIKYPNFIESTFQDIYYTDEENRWLDMVVTNIGMMDNVYKQAIAWFALFQSCIIKRPYNLFHRKNLYIRKQDVERTFGNKKTWDTPFEVHFKKFVEEANNSVFDNGHTNLSLNQNAMKIENVFDMVYIDTPYISENSVGVDYADFYHFVEGLCDYNSWRNKIDWQSKNLRMKRTASDWVSSDRITNSFSELINHFKNSILTISYRSNGIPTIDTLREILKENGKNVEIFTGTTIKYVLSNKASNEVLLVGY